MTPEEFAKELRRRVTELNEFIVGNVPDNVEVEIDNSLPYHRFGAKIDHISVDIRKVL